MRYNITEKELIEIFVSTILTTNRGYSFYINWHNAMLYKDFEIELHAMDSLIRSKNFEKTIKSLLKKVPSVVSTFPLLFALSKTERDDLWKNKSELEIASVVSNASEKINFSLLNSEKTLSDLEINTYYNFFNDMGLKALFENLLEKSVVDYVIGVLVGLDTHGRKNRSGSAFEYLCTEVISPICDKLQIKLITQKQFKVLEKNDFTIGKDIADRKADYILIKNNKAVNIETNYYFTAGSKPEEIVDSYINRKSDLEKNGIDFILITDGLCWNNEYKNQLNKAFRHINIMNYYMANNGTLEELLSEIFNL